MISREELQRVKDYAVANKNGDTFESVCGGRELHLKREDSERLLDLPEEAERYAREDALKEMAVLDFNGTEVKDGDEVLILSNWANWSSLEAGQVVTVNRTMPDGWVVVDDEAGEIHFIKARCAQRIEPDPWEQLETDARRSYRSYWQCLYLSCDDCPALIDGKAPRDFYGADHCLMAQKLDLVARAKRLAKGGE